MDYSLSNALSYNAAGITDAYVLYDIMCQYGVHLDRRFSNSPYIKIPLGLTIWKGIGLFHVHGHQDACMLRYSPTYLRGSGNVDGEILETMWASLNKVSGSTRTMSTSHRQETLDLHMNDWNWKKMVAIGTLTSCIFRVSGSSPAE